MRRHRAAWTRAEEDLLRTQFPTTRTADLAARIGRTHGAVVQRAIDLGLRKTRAHKGAVQSARYAGRRARAEARRGVTA